MSGARPARRTGDRKAHQGTLFFDEIGEIPLELQAKLLHVLQDGEVSRVVGEKIIRTAVRLIASTNRDLKAAMQAHQFREDLYYRLNIFEIRIPPCTLSSRVIGPSSHSGSLGRVVTLGKIGPMAFFFVHEKCQHYYESGHPRLLHVES